MPGPWNPPLAIFTFFQQRSELFWFDTICSILRKESQAPNACSRSVVIFIRRSIIFAHNTVLAFTFSAGEVWYACPTACRRLQSLPLWMFEAQRPDVAVRRGFSRPSVSFGMECVCTDSKLNSLPCFLYRAPTDHQGTHLACHARIDVACDTTNESMHQSLLVCHLRRDLNRC